MRSVSRRPKKLQFSFVFPYFVEGKKEQTTFQITVATYHQERANSTAAPLINSILYDRWLIEGLF